LLSTLKGNYTGTTRNKRTSFPPPTPEERRANIAACRWALFDLFGYEPHEPQVDFHDSDARFRMTIAGTRGGKSRSAGEEAVIYLFAGATRVWIIGQSYAFTEKEFRYVHERMTSQEVYQLFGGDPLESHSYNESQGNMYLRTKWGAEVKCISLDRAGGALGEEIDLAVLSEAAQIKRPKNVYERVLRGRLSTRLGDMIIPTTPAGRTNAYDQEGWLYDMYLKGYDEDEPDYFTREWPSWANPTFREDPYELRRELDEKIFAEQYLGQFVIFTGSIYSDFAEPVHVIDPFMIPKHWRRYEAIDPGFRGQFAWLASVISEQDNIYIIDEYDDQETAYEDRVKNIKNKRCEEYDIPHGMWDTFARKNEVRTTLYIDPEDPQCGFEFARLGLSNHQELTNNNVMLGIDRVRRRLKWGPRQRPRLFVTSNCKGVIDCFRNHAWGEKGDGIRKPANDRWKHKMDCARYICAGNLIPSPPAPTVQEQNFLWELLMQLQDDTVGQPPFAMSAADRRRDYAGTYRSW